MWYHWISKIKREFSTRDQYEKKIKILFIKNEEVFTVSTFITYYLQWQRSRGGSNTANYGLRCANEPPYD